MTINDMRETSNNNNSKLITCPMCGTIFYTQQALDRHNRMIIMNLIARQDIIDKLATVILFLKASI